MDARGSWFRACASCLAITSLTYGGFLSAQESSRRTTSEIDPAAAVPNNVDLQPCSFKEVTPGVTTEAELTAKLGAAAEEAEFNGKRVLTYHVEPFARVEVQLGESVVESIVLHLKSPAAPKQIETELQLSGIDAAPVYSPTGQLLGRAYPERGVLFHFDATAQAHKVVQLVLQPVTAELFVLRAKQDMRHRLTRDLADLEIALQLDPRDADTWLRKARLLSRIGKNSEALAAVQSALEQSPGLELGMLLEAELLLQLDRLQEANEKVTSLVADAPTDPFTKARGEKLLGDLLAQGAEPDYQQAIEHHLAAIKLASPLATDKSVEIRRQTKKFLIDSFLASAQDIAAGSWQSREATTAKWLASARDLANAAVTNDGGDELWKLDVQLATLHAHAVLDSAFDPEPLMAAITKEIQRLADDSGDALFAQQLTVARVRGLYDAAAIAHRRQRSAQAREFAEQGAKLVENLPVNQPLTPADRYLLGRLYFFVGSTHAVTRRDHGEAVRWYAKAQKYLTDAPPNSAAHELGRHGERYVSMGASFWEIEDHQEGMSLTRRGLDLMQQASERGLVAETALALPYNNLAAMHKLQGNAEEAREFAELAERIGQSTKR